MDSFIELKQKYDLPDTLSGDRIAIFAENLFRRKSDDEINEIITDFHSVAYKELGKYFDCNFDRPCAGQIAQMLKYLYENVKVEVYKIETVYVKSKKRRL